MKPLFEYNVANKFDKRCAPLQEVKLPNGKTKKETALENFLRTRSVSRGTAKDAKTSCHPRRPS